MRRRRFIEQSVIALAASMLMAAGPCRAADGAPDSAVAARFPVSHCEGYESYRSDLMRSGFFAEAPFFGAAPTAPCVSSSEMPRPLRVWRHAYPRVNGAAATAYHPVFRQPVNTNAVFNAAQISALKNRLMLDEGQLPRWQDVEDALRDLQWVRHRGSASTLEPKALERFLLAARSLLSSLRPAQKQEITMLAHIAGVTIAP